MYSQRASERLCRDVSLLKSLEDAYRIASTDRTDRTAGASCVRRVRLCRAEFKLMFGPAATSMNVSIATYALSKDLKCR